MVLTTPETACLFAFPHYILFKQMFRFFPPAVSRFSFVITLLERFEAFERSDCELRWSLGCKDGQMRRHDLPTHPRYVKKQPQAPFSLRSDRRMRAKHNDRHAGGGSGSTEQQQSELPYGEHVVRQHFINKEPPAGT